MPGSSSAYSTEESEGGQHEWAVDYIARARVTKRLKRQVQYEYFVKWTGYGEETNTWEPVSSFSDRTTIDDFWAAADTRGADPMDPAEVATDDEFAPKRRHFGSARKPITLDSDDEPAADDTPRRSGRLSAHLRTRSSSRTRTPVDDGPQRTSARLRRRSPAVAKGPPSARLRSALKRRRVSAEPPADDADEAEDAPPARTRPRRGPAREAAQADAGTTEESLPARRKPVRKAEAGGDSLPSDVDPSEVATAEFLATAKIGPPRRKKKQAAARAPSPGPLLSPPPSSSLRPSRRAPTSPEEEAEHAPTVRVPELALTRTYASVATQTARCACSDEFVETGLLTTPAPAKPAKRRAPLPPPPSSSISSTVVGVSSDGTPIRQFHAGSQPAGRSRASAMGRLQNYSGTPDIEPMDDGTLSEKDEDPIENESPVRAPVASSSAVPSRPPYPRPAPGAVAKSAFRVGGVGLTLSEAERKTVTRGRVSMA